MVTNEVNGLRPGQGNHAAVITARGKLVGEGRVIARENDELLLDLDPEAHAATLDHLDRFLVSEDCQLHDLTGRLAFFAVCGAQAPSIFSAVFGAPMPELPLHHHVDVTFAGAPAMVLAAAPAGVAGWELWVPAPIAAAAWEALLHATRAAGGAPAGDALFDAARIHHAVPRFGVDMDEGTIPLEANLVDAISYTKGCYVGQEVIARATYRGQLRRYLAQLSVPAGTVRGAELLDGERHVGSITSVLDPDPAGGPPLALGFVHRDRLGIGTRLTVAGGGEATVLRAPSPRES
jgi:aminomethyltransferase